MRKRFTVLIVFLLGLWAGRFWVALTASADSAPGGSVATENGDTNGDGQRDISDAVHLLRWLFLEGPAPVPFEEPCSPRFVDNGDGTVTDRDSGLMWLQSTLDVNGDGAIGDEDRVTDSDARALASELELAGHSGWRMPTQMTLSTLIVYRDGTTTLDPAFDVTAGIHWGGSSNAGDPCHGAPYVINLPSGYIEMRDPYGYEQTALVLLVRTP